MEVASSDGLLCNGQCRVGWNATLSSRRRVLLQAQPIMLMRQLRAAGEGTQSHYDPKYLSTKLFEVVIDQSGFGNEVVHKTAAEALFPLLESLDIAEEIAPEVRRHERVVERLLDCGRTGRSELLADEG